MAYDTELADQIRRIVRDEQGLTEKRMFGGLAFLINGRLAAGANSEGGMLLRVNPAQAESLVASLGITRFKMRGRQMDGWLRVDPHAVITDDALRKWLSHGVGFARSLPPK